MKRSRQFTLQFPQRGGARKGAGRKPKGEQSLVSHAKRAALAARHPLHVTLRVESGLRSLRTPRAHNAVRAALAAGASRYGMRLVEYVVMTNHIHLICEVEGTVALSRGIKGLGVRIARALNRRWSRIGSVFADRYHCHVLKSPREVRNALNYVLQNAAHHKIHFAGPDPCSSGAWFDGWQRKAPESPFQASPLPRARTWLLTVGWRRHGLIDLLIH
jgi:REP element-mobilizing transposase RayT